MRRPEAKEIPILEAVASSQCLIMEDRPPGVPAKQGKEKERQLSEYTAILSSARKREREEQEERMKRVEERRKQEDDLSAAVHHW